MSDLISRQDAIKVIEDLPNCYNGFSDTYDKAYIIGTLEELPSAERKSDEESELKFYYVESIDDYWIGKRLDNFYYADWNDGLGFVWSHSRYLPWGKHIINENTLWKEHTYPSEPVEIPFTTWIAGFMKKHSAERKGKWIKRLFRNGTTEDGDTWALYNTVCSECDYASFTAEGTNFCPNCGADMRGEEE